MPSHDLELFARCAQSFETVLADELRSLHMRRVRPLKGGVSFFGDKRDAYRACLWSRVATRIQLVLGRVPAVDADALYGGIATMAWEDHVREGATIAVDAHGTNANLRNTAFTALKAKDALCDRLKGVTGARPNVDPRSPDFGINIALHERKATVYLNLSGESLHRRGYREAGVQTAAPLKETLAAGMLLAAGWGALAQEGGVLVDPMCGSGTIAIEAALIAEGIAPGLQRERWGFEGWAQHDEVLWGEGVFDAAERSGAEHNGARVIAGDIDASAINIARDNVQRAGVQRCVQLFVDNAAHMGKHLRGVRKRGDRPTMLVTNPPYGERLSTHDELSATYAALAQAIDALPDGWSAAILTPDARIDTALGRKPHKTLACLNGPIEVNLRMYRSSDAQQLQEVVSLGGKQHSVAIADEKSVQFAARLRKVAKQRRRWARSEGITCYRVYDADLPDYPYAVDVYGVADKDTQTLHATIEERRRPKSVDHDMAERRLADATSLVAAVFDLPMENVHLRQHARNAASVQLWMRERSLFVLVDLLGRPNTGLPLQDRGVRAMVGKCVKGKRFLNVFGSSAATSLFAAAGGASKTTTVEEFSDRVELIKQSLSRNGFGASRHEVICKEPRAWLGQAVKQRRTYDVILCDVPVWLNEVDAESCVAQSARLLAKGGMLIVTCHSNAFFPHVQGYTVKDKSTDVAQPDFARATNALHCFELRSNA